MMKKSDIACFVLILVFLTIGCNKTDADLLSSEQKWKSRDSNIVSFSPLAEQFKTAPQIITTSRLLHIGESISFRFFLPDGLDRLDNNAVTVFPRYLEQANPNLYKLGGRLAFLSSLPQEHYRIRFNGNWAMLDYTPERTGNYLLRWDTGDETFYRYFSVIDNRYTVLNVTTFMTNLKPAFHEESGASWDQWLPIDDFVQGDTGYELLLERHRHFGNTLMPLYPETPDLSVDERVEIYQEGLKKARSMLPDQGDADAGRIGGPDSLLRFSKPFSVDPGYGETFQRLGIINLCGYMCANERPWLGMPEFPFFASAVDCRKIDQTGNSRVVAHQWDFAGSWHFLAPVTWHYNQTASWPQAEHCLRSGLNEFENAARINGHPSFVCGLIYEGFRDDYANRTAWPGPWREGVDSSREAQSPFWQEYIRMLCFRAPKDYHVVYSRSVDVARYYLRHYKTTPQTVFLSRTDHLTYDEIWTPQVLHEGISYARDELHWHTQMERIMTARKMVDRGRDIHWRYRSRLSKEYLFIENQQRQIEFHRECPNPIWWFDYTKQEYLAEGGSSVVYTETPNVYVSKPKWCIKNNAWNSEVVVKSDIAFEDYAICLWGIPRKWNYKTGVVSTNAKGYQLVPNTDEESHLVLFFDLETPQNILYVKLEHKK